MHITKLIAQSPSMDEIEKEMWMEYLPYMTELQKEKLKKILQTEKEKIDANEAKYELEMKKIDERMMELCPKDLKKSRQEFIEKLFNF